VKQDAKKPPAPPASAKAPPKAAPARTEPPKTASVSFMTHVMPTLDKFGCNTAPCHGSAGGKGGLKLSMFGAYPKQDYAAITKWAAGRRINRVEPRKSLFLLKTTGGVAHKGGKPVKPGSPDYRSLVSWLDQGAPWGDDQGPRLVCVEVRPEKPTLKKGETQQISVTAVYADGARKDVTGVSRYQSSETAVAAVTAGGEVRAQGFGQAAIVVTYMRRSAVARVAVPQPLPSPFPETPTHNKVDELVFAKLKELGIPPSPLCSDQEFLRRVFLDVIGLLPTPDEARAFLSDTDPKKRSKLIDQLLQRDELADFWALKWGDLLRIKSELASNLWPNAVQAYHHWVRDSMAKNKPYDQFARELLVSGGSNFRDAPSNYYRALRKRDAQGYAAATALVFMGVRLGCARCHGHPLENWTLDDNMGMAAFFAQVRIKKTREWKEEIVYVNAKQTLRRPTTRQVVAPKVLDGEELKVVPGEDLRVKFAEWLTSPKNPWFAGNIVNRIWFWLLGRGIVHDVDDMRPTNPPSNPELLAYLESELAGHKYDLRHIYRLILNSRTYQLSSKVNPHNANDVAHFSHYPVKRLGAEQLLDAIGQVTETSESYMSRVPEPYTRLPPGTRATQLTDGSIGSPFLQLFGRPPRDSAYESDRCSDTSMRQALYLINSSGLEGKVRRSPRIPRLLKAGKKDPEIVDEIFLAALSRFPSREEKQKTVAYLAKDPKKRNQAVQDLMWAVLNTKEFLFNH